MSILAFLIGVLKFFFTAFFVFFLFALLVTLGIIFLVRYLIRKKMREIFPEKEEKRQKIDENIIDL